MATVNFSIPDDVKQAFNQTFQHQNKSAVICELMMQAIDRATAGQRSHDAIGRILARHQQAPTITQEEIKTILLKAGHEAGCRCQRCLEMVLSSPAR